jgi:DNA gyrase subunit B
MRAHFVASQSKDAAAAEAMFELLMGNDVAPRKEFISTAEIDRDRIDA